MKFKPLLKPSPEVAPVCPSELDKLLFSSHAIATSLSSTCEVKEFSFSVAGVSFCASSSGSSTEGFTTSVAELSGEGTWSVSSVASVDRGLTL